MFYDPVYNKSQSSGAGLDPALLGQLDNYSPDLYTPVGVERQLELLRSYGWLERTWAPSHSLVGQTTEQEAARAFARQLTLLREVGQGSLPLGRIFEGHVNALELVGRFATDAQRERYAQDVRAGRLFGVWNTEQQDGVRIIKQAGGGYVLAGAKTFCSGARSVTRPIITGRLEHGAQTKGWQMVVVPMELLPQRAVDDRFWQPLGMQASASYRVDFTGVHLQASDLLGQPNDYHLQPHFSGGAVRFAAVQLGGAQALTDQTIEFLRQLDRTDDPYQVQRVARMHLALESGYNWLRVAADRALPGWKEAAEVVHYANMTRSAILESCNTVLDMCEQAVGARGFLSPKSIQRIYTDLKMYLRQPAPDNTLVAIGRHAVDQHYMPKPPAFESASTKR